MKLFSGSSKTQKYKDPGRFIKTLAILTLVSSSNGLLKDLNSVIQGQISFDTTLFLEIIVFSITFLAIWGIWTMKKWGAYLLFAETAIAVILLYLSGEITKFFTTFLVIILIIMLVWIWALKREWSEFK